MDGHMSKASRDLSRGVGVKSNGLKYGGGNKEGWGTGGQKGRRCGAGGGRRDVAARARLKDVLERKRAAAEAGEDARSGAGAKRKRSGGAGGDGIAKKAHKRDDRPKPKPAVPKPAETTTKEKESTVVVWSSDVGPTIFQFLDDVNDDSNTDERGVNAPKTRRTTKKNDIKTTHVRFFLVSRHDD